MRTGARASARIWLMTVHGGALISGKGFIGHYCISCAGADMYGCGL